MQNFFALEKAAVEQPSAVADRQLPFSSDSGLRIRHGTRYSIRGRSQEMMQR
jgi:hypothetical protein